MNYPELYRYLDEDPITIPSIDHPKMNTKVMAEYLESLKQLLLHPIEAHKTNN
ncbi:hypothetical protein [Polaribacter sp. L3A8]|uniref:hypothetical protein n=1 Tax=Polaribacter sp. L3A8 TaxID=2686361 RepID=UPI0034A0BFE5